MTVLLHSAVVGLLIWGSLASGADIQEKIEPRMLEFEDVQLLALGEEKPPNQLPRIPNPPPKTRRPDVVDPTPARPPEPQPDEPPPDAVPDPEPEIEKDDLLEALSDLHDPARPTNTDVPEGASEGVVGGELTDAALANLMHTYQARLKAELTRRWTLPATVSREEAAALAGEVVVYVRLSRDGYVVDYRFKQRSENPQFDDSIERLIKRFMVTHGGRRLPVPEDPRVLEAVLEQGLEFEKWEYTGH